MQQILRLREVCRATGLGRSSVYLAIRTGTFPAPFPIGERAVGWSSAAVERWIAARMARTPEADLRALVADLNATAAAPSSR